MKLLYSGLQGHYPRPAALFRYAGARVAHLVESARSSAPSWRGAAREVLDLAAQIGSLAPGKQADVIVLDPDTLNFAPRVDEVSQVVFNAQPSNVEWVFVDGRVLKERGTLVGVDAKAVIADANRAAQRVRAALIH